MTVYCVKCGGSETEKSETGNGGYLFAAEEMDGCDVEFFDDLELWKCRDCNERFFK